MIYLHHTLKKGTEMKYLLTTLLLISTAVTAAEPTSSDRAAAENIITYCDNLYSSEPGNYSAIEYCVQEEIAAYRRMIGR